MKRFRAAGHAGPRDAGRLLFGNVTEIHDLTVTELAAAIRAGQLSPVEITEHYLQRIERLNEQVGAFYTVTPELAREQAAAAEKAVASELRGDGAGLSALPPLTGIPIPIKDLNMVAGVRLTYGVPLHWNDAGLPIGVMLAGRMGEEPTLIELSAQLETARPWKDRHPPIW